MEGGGGHGSEPDGLDTKFKRESDRKFVEYMIGVMCINDSCDGPYELNMRKYGECMKGLDSPHVGKWVESRLGRGRMRRIAADLAFMLESFGELQAAEVAGGWSLCGECKKAAATNKIGGRYFCDPCRDVVFKVHDEDGRLVSDERPGEPDDFTVHSDGTEDAADPDERREARKDGDDYVDEQASKRDEYMKFKRGLGRKFAEYLVARACGFDERKYAEYIGLLDSPYVEEWVEALHRRYHMDQVIGDLRFVLESFGELKESAAVNDRRLCGECKKIMASNKIGDLRLCDPCRDEFEAQRLRQVSEDSEW